MHQNVLLGDVDIRCAACVTEFACVIELAHVQTLKRNFAF